MPRRILPALFALGLLAAIPAAAPAAVTLGEGYYPSAAIDGAGTAYIVYNGAENQSSIRFCRLPRGATACDVATTIGPTGATTSLSTPFVSVSGSTVRIVQYRYGGAPFSTVYRYASTDGGASFGAGSVIGSEPLEDGIFGPGDTFSGITSAYSEGTVFQNVPLGGGTAGTTRAVLDVFPYSYQGAIGMIDGATPLAAYANASGFGRFRRYVGSGALNSAASWTPGVDIGYVHSPRLAGGPAGLFLLASRQDGTIVSRRWDGSTFGPEVDVLGIADGDDTFIAQDAAGRLHAVAAAGRVDGYHLRHATSDDGASWRSGTALIEPGDPIYEPRAAIAPDHVGVAVYYTRLQSGPRSGFYEVRVQPIGPEAPVDPPPPPPPPPAPGGGGQSPPPGPAQPGALARRAAGLPKGSKPPATARRLPNGDVRVAVKGVVRRPAGISRARGCRGKVGVRFKRGKRAIATKTLKLNRRCVFRRKFTIARLKVKAARRLAMAVNFKGNPAVAPAKRTYKLPIKGRR